MSFNYNINNERRYPDYDRTPIRYEDLSPEEQQEIKEGMVKVAQAAGRCFRCITFPFLLPFKITYYMFKIVTLPITIPFTVINGFINTAERLNEINVRLEELRRRENQRR